MSKGSSRPRSIKTRQLSAPSPKRSYMGIIEDLGLLFVPELDTRFTFAMRYDGGAIPLKPLPEKPPMTSADES